MEKAWEVISSFFKMLWSDRPNNTLKMLVLSCVKLANPLRRQMKIKPHKSRSRNSPTRARSEGWPSSGIRSHSPSRFPRSQSCGEDPGLRVNKDHIAGVLFQFHVVSVMVSVISRDSRFKQAVHSLTLLFSVRVLIIFALYSKKI